MVAFQTPSTHSWSVLQPITAANNVMFSERQREYNPEIVAVFTDRI